MKNLKLKTVITLGNMSIVLMVFVLGIINYSELKYLLNAGEWVEHTHAVLTNAKKIEQYALDMETGMRGYLLTGKTIFLEPYESGRVNFKNEVQSLKELVNDNPGQVQLIGEAEAIINNWNANVVEPRIDLRKKITSSKSMEDIAKIVSEGKGKKYFDKMRLLINELISTEKSKGAFAESRNALQELEINFINMETGMRGYLLSGKKEFLEPFSLGEKKLEESFLVLRKLTNSNDYEMKLVDELEKTFSLWLNEVVNPMLSLRQEVELASSMYDLSSLVGKGEGKKYFDEFRAKMKLFSQKEEILLDQRKKESNESIDNTVIAIILGVLIAALLGTIISIMTANFITKPIERLVEWVKSVEKGNNEIIEITNSKNEIGILENSFKNLIISIIDITDICSFYSLGDYSKAFEIRSEEDSLGKAINSMRMSFLEVISQSKKIADGDYTSKIIPRSSKDELSLSLKKMLTSLKKSREANTQQKWTKTGQTEISELMQGDNETRELANEVITKLATYINADVGTIFINEEEEFKLVGSYAFTRRKKHVNRVKKGEGLVGQVILEKKTMVLSNLPDNYMTVSSSIGEAVVRELIILPCIYHNEIKAVIELGKIESFTEHEIEFLKLVSENIAIGIHSSEAQSEMKLLLDKTLKQAEELQQQQEELRQTNKELEEQARALKDSEEELKQQQEELRQTNEELEEQTKSLQDSEDKLRQQQEKLKLTNGELQERTENLELQKKEINEKNEILKQVQIEIEEKAKDLESASKYKSEFLANMSHELRTPLNSILILSQLLSQNKSNNLNTKEVDFANTINNSGTDLLNLINDILDLSKIEAGKMDIYLEEFEIKSLIDYIEKTFEHVAKDKGIKLLVEIEKETPEKILCDEQRLGQVIKNLMSNAIKFTTKGQVELKIFDPKELKFKNTHLNKVPKIAISVKDTGIGIAKEKLDNIFEAFQQADGTTSRKFGGTGLGLSISREFIKMFGGEIHVSSEEKKGSEFIIIIPTKSDNIQTSLVDFSTIESLEEKFTEIDEHSHINGSVQDTEKDKKEDKISTQTNILEDDDSDIDEDILVELPDDLGVEESDYLLIIEDDPKFASLVENLASEKGFKVLTAGSGEKGLAIAKKIKPLAVILDIGLPGINGWTVVDKMKKDKKLNSVPVHIMSATDADDKIKDLGIADFIQKPVSVEKLNSAFDKINTFVSNDVKKILIVEDNDIQRESIKAFMLANQKELEITSASNAEDTFKLLKDDQFDCIVLDLGLSDMSGIELLTKIRVEDISQVPIIIYTGRSLTKAENEDLEKYAEAVIIKGPQSMDRLLEETDLFLHHIKDVRNGRKEKEIRSEYDKEKSMNGKRVLIVDDDLRNLFALTNLLEDKGLEVEVAKNGLQAVEKAEDGVYDAILMDIMMPEMDGYTAMRRIRKINGYNSIPIIALTAKAMKEDRDKCINAGANDYMSKPIQGDQLLSLLRVWLY